MVCDNCGSEVRVSKALTKGGSPEGSPDECPHCGADLSKDGDQNGNRLEKGV